MSSHNLPFYFLRLDVNRGQRCCCGCRVATDLMLTLHDATKLLLEYLESKAEDDKGLEEPLSLAVARSLGRCAFAAGP